MLTNCLKELPWRRKLDLVKCVIIKESKRVLNFTKKTSLNSFYHQNLIFKSEKELYNSFNCWKFLLELQNKRRRIFRPFRNSRHSSLFYFLINGPYFPLAHGKWKSENLIAFYSSYNDFFRFLFDFYSSPLPFQNPPHTSLVHHNTKLNSNHSTQRLCFISIFLLSTSIFYFISV